jgi:hypothetical protein
MISREQRLLTALEAALEYIDAIPSATANAFPAMPGFDRDDVETLIHETKARIATQSTTRDLFRNDRNGDNHNGNSVGSSQGNGGNSTNSQTGGSNTHTTSDTQMNVIVTPRMEADRAGTTINLDAKIGYPGSRVSDLFIGGHKVQVPNEAIRQAMGG